MNAPSLLAAARRSLTLARNANRARRYVLNLQQPYRAAGATANVQDWAKLLDSLEADVRPLVVTSREQPFHIVAVNDSWTQMCGFSHTEALGQSLEMLQGPSTDRLAIADFERRLAHARAGDEIDLHVVNYTKDRRAFLNEVHVTPIDVSIDGGVTPMFVGALSFKRWCPVAEEAALAAEAAAAVAAGAVRVDAVAAARPTHFTFAQALARSGAPRVALPRPDAQAAAAFNLSALNSLLAF